MLIGEYQHNLDPKKRLAIPSKFRKKLGNLPMSQQSTRAFARLLLSGAVEVEFDVLGRILIPEYLKTYAGLGKTAVIAGLYNRLEIWDTDRWTRYKEKLEKDSDSIAEKLGGGGENLYKISFPSLFF